MHKKTALVLFYFGKFRALASPVALAPAELGVLTQPRSPTRETSVLEPAKTKTGQTWIM
jgi:hypothetical protein